MLKRREFLQKPKTYNPKKHDVSGWLISEKLDGMRVFWDGGITRGMPASEVPWADTDKDSRLQVQPVSTGLWSFGRKVVNAHPKWLDELDIGICADGELWMGRGKFQTLMKIVKNPPDARWGKVAFVICSKPDYEEVFRPGMVAGRNSKLKIAESMFNDWIKPKLNHTRIQFNTPHVIKLEELKIPSGIGISNSAKIVRKFLKGVLRKGGEGIVIRNPKKRWEPKRSKNILKWKPFEEAEGIVTGYISGRKTDKGSRLLGKMGALVLDYNGKRLELSGFEDKDRVLNAKGVNDENRSYSILNVKALKHARKNPETEMPSWIQSEKFPRGTVVTFIYRELSDDGIPKEARYKRMRQDD